MRILIADDAPTSRHLLELTLSRWGYHVAAVADGDQAFKALQEPDAPSLAILDWMMPGMDGPEVCRKIREAADPSPTYIILLTARNRRQDTVTGLQAGADDFVTKPFDHEELRARVQVGVRVLELQRALAGRVRELEQALGQVKQLQGLLPICAYCKKVRDDKNYWQQVETYVAHHSEARFSHGICPTCYEAIVKPDLELARRGGPAARSRP